MWRPLNRVAYLLMAATKLAKSEAIIIIILLRIKEQLINYAIQHGTTTAVISSLPASYMWTTVDSNIAKHCIWQNVCGGNFHGFHSFSLNCEYFPVKVLLRIVVYHSKCKTFSSADVFLHTVLTLVIAT